MVTSAGVKIDDGVDNPEWDAFLESSKFGHYQQSSMWARAKGCEGWRVERVMLIDGRGILGGAQILWRNSRLGRIGYLSRGPVIVSQRSDHCILLINELKDAARRLNLRALIVQSPEGHQVVDRELPDAGFLPNRIRRIITATWLTPLDGGIDQVIARMRRETRAKLRKALRCQVRVVEGGREDLEVFFDLMLKTCERQGVAPNPGTRDVLEAVWDSFHGGGNIRLGIAVYEGRPISAALSLRFGGRLSIWKKGSDPDFLKLHPMEPVYHDSLEWGCREGDHICDHGSLKQATAETLLAGHPLTDEMKSSRDFYNMRFGGHAELLPEAWIYIPNPLLRAIYRTTACSALGAKILKGRYQC